MAGVVVAVLGSVVAGCGAVDLGGSVGPNEWHVLEIAPDDRTVLVGTTFGGVASDCTRWADWEARSTDDRVTIEAMLWRRRLPGGCTDDGAGRTLRLELDEPLGDRTLVGCGHDDCRDLATGDAFDVAATVRGLADGVVVARDDVLTALDLDGVVRWERTRPTWRVEVGPDVVATTAEVDEVVAFDPTSGEVRWQAPGVVVGSFDDLVVACEALDGELELEGGGVLVARAATTGEVAWRVDDVPCQPLVRVGANLLVVAADDAVDGGHEVVVVAAATGEVLARRPVDDGTDDRVAGFDALVARGGSVVAGGIDADLVVLDESGGEAARRSDTTGRPIGTSGAMVVLADDRGLTGVDLDVWELAWSVDLGGDGATMSDGVLVVVDGAEVAALDPATGATRWSVPVRATDAVVVVAGEGAGVTVVTPLSTTMVESATGAVMWSRSADGSVTDVLDLPG